MWNLGAWIYNAHSPSKRRKGPRRCLAIRTVHVYETLRPELRGVGAPDTPVVQYCREDDDGDGSLLYEDRRLAGWAATAGKDDVFEGDASCHRGDGIEAECCYFVNGFPGCEYE